MQRNPAMHNVTQPTIQCENETKTSPKLSSRSCADVVPVLATYPDRIVAWCEWCIMFDEPHLFGREIERTNVKHTVMTHQSFESTKHRSTYTHSTGSYQLSYRAQWTHT